MNSLDFSEKVKQFMKVYLTGMDISGDRSIEDVYSHDDFFSSQYNLEYEMLNEIENYITPRVLDEIEPQFGREKSESIVGEITDRISAIKKKIIEKYEDREDKARTFNSQIDDYGADIDSKTEQGTQIRDEVVQQIITQVEQDSDLDSGFVKERPLFRVNDIRDDLMPYFENVFRVLDISYLSRSVMDIFDDYESKEKKINMLIEQCVEDIKIGKDYSPNTETKMINNQAVSNFYNDIGKDPTLLADYVRSKYIPGEFDKLDYVHDSLGPKEVGVNVGSIEMPEYFDGKNKEIRISETIIRDSDYGQKDLLQDKEYRFYRNETSDTIEYIILTEDEGKRLELRSNELKQRRVFAPEKDEKDNSKSYEYEVPTIF